MLAAFEEAGLAESHVEWLQGNFFGGEPGPTEGDLCAGANGAVEHEHFFTEDTSSVRTMKTAKRSTTVTTKLLTMTRLASPPTRPSSATTVSFPSTSQLKAMS